MAKLTTEFHNPQDNLLKKILSFHLPHLDEDHAGLYFFLFFVFAFLIYIALVIYTILYYYNVGIRDLKTIEVVTGVGWVRVHNRKVWPYFKNKLRR